MKPRRYRRCKPETPGSKVYWDAFQRWEEYCEFVAQKQNARVPRNPKPFFRFIIGEIDAALKEARKAEKDDSFKHVTASLVAAIYLLEHGGKKAAASDRMFYQMLDDYKKAADRAATLLRNS